MVNRFGVRCIPVRPRVRRARLGAFALFLGVVMAVHTRGCRVRFRSIPVHPWGSRVRLGAFRPFPTALTVVVCVRSIPERDEGHRVRSRAFG